MLAHILTCLVLIIGFLPFLFGFEVKSLISFVNLAVEDCSLLDEDLAERITAYLGLHVVANLALETDIGNETLSRLEVDAW